MMNGWDYTNGTDQVNVWGGFSMLLFTVVIVVAGVFIVRYYGKNHDMHHHVDSAIDILNKRYANGEIDSKEYAERSKVLTDAAKAQ